MITVDVWEITCTNVVYVCFKVAPSDELRKLWKTLVGGVKVRDRHDPYKRQCMSILSISCLTYSDAG